MANSEQVSNAPRKFTLGPLGTLNQVIKALSKTIRAMADGTLDSQVGARICNGATNPPFGQGGRQATAFIEVGLRRLPVGAMLALLLPCDFDSAKTRARYFGDRPEFVGKIVLRERIVWFQRDDGVREAPKENSAWFIWQRSLLRIRRPPIILYAPANGEAAR